MTSEYMNEKTEDAPKHPIGEVLLELIEIILRRRKFMARFVLSVTVVTMIVVLFLPKWYKSTATVMPAEKTDILGGLEGVSSLVKSFSGGKGISGLGGQSELQRYTAILKSDRMAESVVEKFDLKKVYNITSDSREAVTKELAGNFDVNITDEGNLSVSVYDKDPSRAAQMANYFIDQLNTINAEINAQNSKAYREFLEQRYQTSLAALAAAEESMKSFQESHGVLAVPEQMEAAIKTSAELYGMLALKEVEAGVLERSVSVDNPVLREKQNEIQEMKKKLNEMRRGTEKDSTQMKLFLPLNQTPALGTQYVRLLRDLKTQSKIVEFITPVYEQAKMEEKRNTPTVMVLDKAVPAEHKSKPKGSLYTLFALIVSSLISLAIVAVVEMIDRLKLIASPRLVGLLSTARADWFGLRMKQKKMNK